MRITRDLALAVACAAGGGERLELAPVEGGALLRTISTHCELEVPSRGWLIGPGSGDLHPWNSDPIELGSVSQELVVRDVFARVDGERVRRLERHFRRVEVRADKGAWCDSEILEDQSSLEGAAVVFNDGDVEWSREDRLLADAWIRDLRPELDFAELLPGRAVEVGDSWRVPGSLIETLVHPGGRHPFEDLPEDARDLLGDLSGVEDELRVVLVDLSQRGGEAAAELRVVGSVEARTWTHGVEQIPLPFVGEVEALVETTTSATLHVEGRVEWNLERKRWETADLEGSIELEIVQLGDAGLRFDARVTTHGEGRFAFHATASEPGPDDE